MSTTTNSRPKEGHRDESKTRVDAAHAAVTSSELPAAVPTPPIDLLHAIAGHDSNVAPQQIARPGVGAGCDPARQATAARTEGVGAERQNGIAGK